MMRENHPGRLLLGTEPSPRACALTGEGTATPGLEAPPLSRAGRAEEAFQGRR